MFSEPPKRQKEKNSPRFSVTTHERIIFVISIFYLDGESASQGVSDELQTDNIENLNTDGTVGL